MVSSTKLIKKLVHINVILFKEIYEKNNSFTVMFCRLAIPSKKGSQKIKSKNKLGNSYK